MSRSRKRVAAPAVADAAPADDAAPGSVISVADGSIEGSREAVRRATVILEVLTGLRGPTEGSQALDVGLTRYYQLEAWALQGMVSALEPRPRGRRPKPAEDRVVVLEAENAKLQQELCRAHGLVRQAQRAIGLTAPASERKGRKKVSRRGKPRAVKVIDQLAAAAREVIADDDA